MEGGTVHEGGKVRRAGAEVKPWAQGGSEKDGARATLGRPMPETVRSSTVTARNVLRRTRKILKTRCSLILRMVTRVRRGVGVLNTTSEEEWKWEGRGPLLF